MESDVAVDLTRQAMSVSMMLCAPVLIVGMIAGLLIGLLQAVTQVQDQTVAFVPKLIAMVVALAASLPWALSMLIEYSRTLFGEAPVGGWGVGG
ncbi:MAG TPA: flagellar biosynthetic protein FliQ [Planctomycetaceae bacterium]|nr:flagellar biosynthetic protein FliQ [Planctomycetaceae bacterium]HRF01397.1 flagellar biosynthesis protein FliQ [Pirellulaceae bacterium]